MRSFPSRAYGTVQVKSRLNRTEIIDGLENIAAFKKLQRMPAPPRAPSLTSSLQPSDRGFGLLFAYDSDLKWLDIIREIEAFSNGRPNTEWCNAVFILDKGAIFTGKKRISHTQNPLLEKISKLTMHGRPDRQNQCLYQFYHVLLHLLRTTDTQPANADAYFGCRLSPTRSHTNFLWGLCRARRLRAARRLPTQNCAGKVPETHRLVQDCRTYQLDSSNRYRQR